MPREFNLDLDNADPKSHNQIMLELELFPTSMAASLTKISVINDAVLTGKLDDDELFTAFALVDRITRFLLETDYWAHPRKPL